MADGGDGSESRRRTRRRHRLPAGRRAHRLRFLRRGGTLSEAMRLSVGRLVQPVCESSARCKSVCRDDAGQAGHAAVTDRRQVLREPDAGPGYVSQIDDQETFCVRLMELDLLGPVPARFAAPGGKKARLGGIPAINCQRNHEMPEHGEKRQMQRASDSVQGRDKSRKSRLFDLALRD